MSKLFLSHSSANNVEAIALRDWLIAAGFADLFLDLDPLRGIAAGERWEKALLEAANRCEAVVFLVSKEWLASGWCRKEYGLAQKLNKRMFGVIIDDTAIADVPPEISGDWQLISVFSGTDHATYPANEPHLGMDTLAHFSRSGLQQLNAGLRKAGLDPGYFEWPPRDDPHRAPYRGLSALDAVDAGIFFGRDAQIIEGLDRIRGLREAHPPRLLVILGASGAGKSSFLRAGLWPRLGRDDRHFLPLPVLRPGRAALSGDTGLISVLATALEAAEIPTTRRDLEATVTQGPAAIAACLRALLAKCAPRGDANKVPALVLAIDQGEELFLSSNDPAQAPGAVPGNPEGARLLELLSELLRLETPELIAVLAIRTDSYQQLQTAEALSDIEQRTMSLPPLPQGAYEEVIKGPARRVSAARRFEVKPGLTDALLRAIEGEGGHGDKLPLLALTLQRLYDEAGSRGQLTAEDFDAIKGIRGSIEAAVERAFFLADADDRVPRDRNARLALLRRGLIPWLAGIDPQTSIPRRNIAPYDDIPAEARPLIDRLVDVHLLSSDITPSGIRILEPAHDALLRQWGLLRGWLEEDLGALTTLEGVKRARRDYFSNAQTPEWLIHTAGRLLVAEAVALDPRWSKYVTASDDTYLSQCRIAEELRAKSELELQRSVAAAHHRAARNRAIGATITSVLAVLFLAAADFGFRRARDAESALSFNDFQQAQRLLSHDDSRSALAYLARALRANPKNTLAAERILYLLAYRNWPAPLCTADHPQVTSGSFSPDDSRFLTTSLDGSIRVWDSTSCKALGAPLQVAGPVTLALWRPPLGDRIFAATGTNGFVWNTDTRLPVGQPLPHDYDIVAAAFSHDGNALFTAASKEPSDSDDIDATGHAYIKRWAVFDNTLIGSPQLPMPAVTAIVLNPTDTALGVAARDAFHIVEPRTMRETSLKSPFFVNEPSDPTPKSVCFAGPYAVVNSVGCIDECSSFVTVWDLSTDTQQHLSLDHCRGREEHSCDLDYESPISAMACSGNTEDNGSAYFLTAEGSTVSLQTAGPNEVNETSQFEAAAADHKVTGVAVSTAEHLIATAIARPGARSGYARIWDFPTLTPRTESLETGGAPSTISLDAKGQRLLTVAETGTAAIWATRDMRAETTNSDGPRSLQQHSIPVVSPPKSWRETHADKRTFLSESLADLLQYAATTSRATGTQMTINLSSEDVEIGEGRKFAVVGIAESHAIAIVTDDDATETSTLEVFDSGTREAVGDPIPLEAYAADVSFRGNEERTLIAVTLPHRVRVFGVTAGRLEAIRDIDLSPDGEAFTGRLSSDGKRIAIAISQSDESLTGIWDVSSGEVLLDPTLSNDDLYPVVLPDARPIEFGDEDWTLALPGARADLFPVREEAPSWLPLLAEAIGGKRLDDAGALQATPFREHVLSEIGKSIQESNNHDSATILARWLLTRDQDRTISPRSSQRRDDR